MMPVQSLLAAVPGAKKFIVQSSSLLLQSHASALHVGWNVVTATGRVSHPAGISSPEQDGTVVPSGKIRLEQVGTVVHTTVVVTSLLKSVSEYNWHSPDLVLASASGAPPMKLVNATHNGVCVHS
jgi:hypothetical protein